MTGHGVLRLNVPEQRDRLERLFGAGHLLRDALALRGVSAITYVEAVAAGVPSIGTDLGRVRTT